VGHNENAVPIDAVIDVAVNVAVDSWLGSRCAVTPVSGCPSRPMDSRAISPVGDHDGEAQPRVLDALVTQPLTVGPAPLAEHCASPAVAHFIESPAAPAPAYGRLRVATQASAGKRLRLSKASCQRAEGALS
jgi:hypothetical protein